MKILETMAPQGDVLVVKVDTLPDNVTEKTGKDANIIAHSETQHNHVVESEYPVQFFSTPDPLVSYMRVPENGYADVVHHRVWDTHETFRMYSGTYEIRRQQEWSPEGWQIVED